MLFAMARWRTESPLRAVVRAVVVTESNTSSCSVGAGSAADPWPGDERSVLYGLLSALNYRPVRRTRTPQRGVGCAVRRTERTLERPVHPVHGVHSALRGALGGDGRARR